MEINVRGYFVLEKRARALVNKISYKETWVREDNNQDVEYRLDFNLINEKDINTLCEFFDINKDHEMFDYDYLILYS